MVDATQVMALGWGRLRSLHLHSWLVLDKSMCWARDVHVPCACTHGWYYASHGVGLGMLTMDVSWKFKHKQRGHPTTHSLVTQYVFIWCWCSSLNNPDPQRFLEEFETCMKPIPIGTNT